MSPDAFAHLPGVEIESATAHRLLLSVRGSVAPVLAVAAPLEPVDLTARPADLDQLFRSFYREEIVGAR